MNKLMEKFKKILDTWNDLPDYVYCYQYRNAFTEFVEKKIAIGQEIEKSLAVWILHNETGGRTRAIASLYCNELKLNHILVV